MNGVSKISSEQDIMMITFTEASAHDALSAALQAFAENDIVVDMICQSAPRGSALDFSFTTSNRFFDASMKTIAAHTFSTAKPPLISRGYSKINLFGEEMVTSCGVAACALQAIEKANIDVVLITTSDLDISLLVREEDEDSALLCLHTAFSV